jgi:MFS family permease
MKFNDIHKLYLFSFIHQLVFFGALAVPFFLDWAKIDYTRIFILQAWYSFWIFALEVPTGVVADKLGRKYSLALGCLASALGFGLYAAINSYPNFLLCEFLIAMGAALLSGADKALLYDTILELKKKKEARAYLARYDAAGTLGIVVSMPFGSFIAGSALLPYPAVLALPMFLTSATGLISIFVALSLHEPERKKPVENPLKLGIDGFKYILKTKLLREISLNYVLISATTFFMFWLYQTLLRDTPIGIVYYGLVGAGINIFAMLLLLNLKRLESIFGMKRLIFLSALLPALFYLAVAFFRNIPMIFAAIFIVTGLRLLRAPVLTDFMNRYITSKNRATVLSGIAMLDRLVIALFYPVVGLLLDKSLTFVLLLLGVATLIFALTTRIGERHF